MANDFESFLATCQRFQDIATWDPENFNANRALARLAELHKREIAAKDAEIAKRDALIKKLVAAFVHLKRKICKDKRVNCKSRGNLSICKYCELIERAREVVAKIATPTEEV